MLSLEREIRQLREEGALRAEVADVMIAQERREVVSVYTEVRVMAWAGVMLMVTGVGIIISKNIDRIGPITIAAAIGIASATCYAYSVWRRASVRRMLDDYILLLGALLLSADVGYIEHQFHLLGSEWPRHFLLLAVVHGATAYFFASRTLLSLSIAALASWFGFERNVDTLFSLFGDNTAIAIRAFTCAGTVAVWRILNRHLDFNRVFDHFVANLGLYGGLLLLMQSDTRILGATIVIVLAAMTIAYGFRKRAESFVIYAYVCAVIAIDVLVIDHLHAETVILSYLVVSTVAAIVGLFVLHARFRKAAA
ncbi:MAG: DUF2157 domain-containing protein [Thermoanaerobaculia bacterium]